MMIKSNTKINWYDLKDYVYLYLKKEALKELIRQGIRKAGSLSKLCINLNSMHFYAILKSDKGTSVKNLKKLLSYIDVSHNFVDDKISEIRRGKKYSIKNPKFPIDLQNSKMGSLLGHIVSDGCLYYDNSRKNFIRTKYCSDDKQGLTMFINNIKEVFGNVNFNQEYIRNCYTIRFGCGVIGDAFRKAGAMVGKKYKLNRGLPWIIKEGDIEIKRSYLSAVFDDEGSVGKTKFPYVILSRNIHVELSPKEIRIMTNVVPLMKSDTFPTGHCTRRIPIKNLKKILKKMNALGLLKKILNSKPKILIEESDLLKHEFGINNSTYVISLQLTSNGHYSVQSCIVIRKKKDVINFYKEIGFSLLKKQKKLKEALISKGWISNGT